MSAITLISKVLLASAAVTAKVDDRVNPGLSPQDGSFPDIILYQSGGSEGYNLCGSDEYPEDRISVECRAESYGAMDRLGDDVIVALRNFNGTIDSNQLTVFKEGTDVYDYGENSSIHRRIIDFRARYRAI